MPPNGTDPQHEPNQHRPLIALAWLWVGLPLAYGLYELTRTAAQLVTG